jgi:uncharacterized membrane protein
MVDYKKAALTGAVVGAGLSFLMGRKRRGFDLAKIGTYGAYGAGAFLAGSFVMHSVGKPVGFLERAGHGGVIGHDYFHPW